MSDPEDPTMPRAEVILELLQGAQIVGELWREMRTQEMRFRALAELAGTSEPISISAVTMAMRAHADRISERGGTLHDVARRLEYLVPRVSQGPR